MGGRGLTVSWTWASARCQGTSHLRDATPCQDAVRCIVSGTPAEILIAVASDGAGSARFAGQGSALVARSISENARSYFSANTALPPDDEVWAWMDIAKDRIGNAASARSSDLRDFAATLVAVFATETETLVMHVGDGAAVLQTDGNWTVPSWPANGEYASTTFFVTDEPAPQLRITRLARRADAVAVFSDGLERLALKFDDNSAFAPFFDGIFTPVMASQAKGIDRELSTALGRYLNSAAVNERTDDDKSLILAIRK
jgi:hypothetical protein